MCCREEYIVYGEDVLGQDAILSAMNKQHNPLRSTVTFERHTSTYESPPLYESHSLVAQCIPRLPMGRRYASSAINHSWSIISSQFLTYSTRIASHRPSYAALACTTCVALRHTSAAWRFADCVRQFRRQGSDAVGESEVSA